MRPVSVVAADFYAPNGTFASANATVLTGAVIGRRVSSGDAFGQRGVVLSEVAAVVLVGLCVGGAPRPLLTVNGLSLWLRPGHAARSRPAPA